MPIHFEHSRRLLAAALTSATLLALAACSDDDSGSDTESGSDAAVEEEQVQAIPVATDFFEETPEWSVSVPADSQVL